MIAEGQARNPNWDYDFLKEDFFNVKFGWLSFEMLQNKLNVKAIRIVYHQYTNPIVSNIQIAV